MEKQVYINGLDKEHTFELIDGNKIIWKGDFKNYKCKINHDQKCLFVNPVGGPHIKIGTPMMYMSYKFVGLVVSEIVIDSKLEVIIKCNKYNNSDLGENFHLQDRDIIGGII
jgi:hypothetical protein